MNKKGPECTRVQEIPTRHRNVGGKCIDCGLPKHNTYARRVWNFHQSYKRAENGCLIWTGNRTNRGYARTSSNAWKTRHAHRVAWFLAKGYWPTELDHTCFQTLCVEVSHLREVTHKENMNSRRNSGLCKVGHLMSETGRTFPCGRRVCGVCYDARLKAEKDARHARGLYKRGRKPKIVSA